MHQTSIVRFLRLLFLLLAGSMSLNAWSIGQCPAVGESPSCGVLITVTKTGALTFQFDPSVPPFDGIEDTLVGVQNNSGATLFGIFLSGSSGIFGFDGDGAFEGNYAGPGVSFDVVDDNNGLVNFDNGLPAGGFLYFSLEGTPTASNLATSVTLDPGHGTKCNGNPQPSGAVGTTSFVDPPKGFLQENVLSVNVATTTQTLLSDNNYRVTLTKSNVDDCPSWKTRADTAENSHSNFFVAIHLNQPVGVIGRSLCGTGTSVLYNPNQADGHTLALDLLSSVSSQVGVGVLETGTLCGLVGDNSNANHDGTYPRPNLAVLKLSKPVAALVEVARLSPPDDATVHDSTFLGNAAAGIKAGLDAFIHP